MSDTPFISVVMPVRNEARFIARSLRSVLAQDYPLDRFEVIVADGMSNDDTREVISRVSSAANVRLIDNPGKIVATGLNLAIREAKGEVIVRVDGHCEIAPDYIRRCAELLTTSDAECVGGNLETIGETNRARVIATAQSSRFGVGGSTFRIGSPEPRYVDTVAFPGYQRETLRRLGEFDEELVRNQDDEYNYRLRKSGGRILLSPELRARYYSRATFKNLFSQYSQYGYWKVRVLQKHPGQMQLRQFIPPLGVVGLLMLLLLAPFLKGVAVLTAACVLVYVLASLFASLLTANRAGWKLVTLLPVAFGIIHLSYGFGFLFGLVKFWNRWTRSTPINIANVSSDATPLSAD